MSPYFDKKTVLQKMYQLYDQQSKNWPIACQCCCSHCCTDRIWMTTIEGSLIIDYIQKQNLQDILNQTQQIVPGRRYHPKTTINQEAFLSIQDAPIPFPDEFPFQECYFLRDNQCTIYPVRPMSCRTMISSVKCQKTGHADMTSIQISMATLFFQYIELLDQGGYYGNYLNIIEMLTSSPEIQPIQHALAKNDLLENTKIHFVMIPPQDRNALIPTMKAIQQCFLNA
ncbi:MAG: hypothetical protein OMM_00915 [Candidatus Magnetoglobus multicellularis str. Araruama]|uniref:YkgJ family cysteine cluster protein n=1 Tax=Candidatus Magnetoglobus multicellularis str. Araruama TaxID=890399 RepID=A0A1V1PFQ1_9BACT|nr:MAG: hypothetical protein OMM_00915 [Candidatus Magnetoglobus multicellularis str. Araruama]